MSDPSGKESWVFLSETAQLIAWHLSADALKVWAALMCSLCLILCEICQQKLRKEMTDICAQHHALQ